MPNRQDLRNFASICQARFVQLRRTQKAQEPGAACARVFNSTAVVQFIQRKASPVVEHRVHNRVRISHYPNQALVRAKRLVFTKAFIQVGCLKAVPSLLRKLDETGESQRSIQLVIPRECQAAKPRSVSYKARQHRCAGTLAAGHEHAARIVRQALQKRNARSAHSTMKSLPRTIGVKPNLLA